MTPAMKRNLIRAPIVLIIRLPIMLFLTAIVMAGEAAESIGERLGQFFPAFEDEP